MQNKTIWVTGIGGNVGQGILRNLRSSFPDIRLIGSNVTRVSAGNYWCDEVVEMPYAWDQNFHQRSLELVKDHQIDLIIPSTDFEVYYLALIADQLPKLVCCPSHEASIFLDKMKTHEAFKTAQIPFATSFETADFDGQVSRYLAKPKMGRGSRGLLFQPTSWKELGSEYMIQEWAEGPEITTAFYVTKDRKVHGHITMVRSLQNGTTMECEVTHEFDHLVAPVIEKMNACFHLVGSLNVQSIVTPNGLVPFEINARISGTNSVRSQFGFDDVQYAVSEYLFNVQPPKVEVQKGSAIRVIMDIIYPGKTLNEIPAGSNNAHIF
jgi:carbamoyl-phosphate synthase large subunit